MSIKNKILFLTLVPLLIVLASIGAATILNKNTSEQNLLINRVVSYRTLLESGDLSFSSTQDKPKLTSLFEDEVNSSALLQTPTTVFYSTSSKNGQPVLPVYSEGQTAFIKDAFRGTETHTIVKEHNGTSLIYVSPVVINHAVVAVLVQSISFTKSNTRILHYALYIITAILVGLLFCYVSISWLLKQAVLTNIYKLKNAASTVSKGDLSTPLAINTKDEIGDLAKTFEQMRINVHDSRVKLEQSNKVLGEEKTRFLTSINSLPLGFLLMDHSGSVLMINPTMKQVLGADIFSDDAGKHDTKESPILTYVLAKATDSIKSKKKTSHEFKTEDARFLRVLTAPVLSSSDSVKGVVVLIEDVTEERILARSKDEFFSIASHELRTPLTAIRGNASMIQTLYSDVLKDKDLAQMVGDIHGSSVRLIEIVNDFLDASRLEQKKMDFKKEVFNISEVVESVVYELTAAMQEKKLYIKSDRTLNRLPNVVADKNRVKQIIYNLTGNALKFTEKGGLSIHAAIAGDHLRISVTDTGRGISPENQNLLFHKFQQASDSLFTRDTTRGTGLGLYISKLLAHGMGGKLTIDKSEIGVGSTFSFTLPLAKASDAAA